MQKKQDEQQALEATKSDIGWGSQIRSYVLDQSRIKDLRTGVEIGNIKSVMDGDLDEFIAASQYAQRLREALKTLPPDQAEVVNLSFFSDKAHGDIGRDLGIPLGTVKSRLRLAMNRLRTALGDTL